MKKTSTKKSPAGEMQSEYDFAGQKGERGKYHKAYRQGHAVRIQKADGNTSVQYFGLKEGTVMLEPDVQPYFPDSDSVNKALRTLITLIPNRTAKSKTTKAR